MADMLNGLMTELNGQAIQLFRYGYDENKTLATLFYDLKDLNKMDIDWKNMKPRRSKVKTNSVYLSGAVGGKVTRQESSLKDQLMTVSAIPDGTHVTVNVIGPVSFKRGESFINITDQDVYVITSDASTATVGATTLNVEVDSSTGATVADAIRLGGYAKPYGLNEGNTFDSDTYTELYNTFTRTNMTITLDQIELNTQRIMYSSVKDYLKEKFAMASRRMLRGVIRDFYMGQRDSSTSIGGAVAYRAGGVDWAIRNLSGLTGVNFGTATGAGTGEININGSDTAGKRRALLDTIDLIYQTGIPNLAGTNNLVFMCTSSFMREIDELFYDKLILNDTIEKVGLTTKTIMFASGPVTFIMDGVLNDIQRTGTTSIRKVAYSIPMEYVQMYLLPNDVVTKDGKTTNSLGYGKIFYVPQSSEEASNLRLYSCYSFAFAQITSGAWRKINLQW